MIQFGTARIWINPNAGNLATNPTPMQPLTVQNFSLDIAVDFKELKGQNQFADDVAQGDKKVTGKFEYGRPDIDLLNQMQFADTRSTSSVPQVSDNEPHSVPASTPFTVTVTNSATFVLDGGVLYAGNPPAGFPQQLQRVTSAPTQGQYSVSAGVYTFAAADTNAAVLISYKYTLTASTGIEVTVNNQAMGYGPQCEIWVQNRYQKSAAGNYPGLILYAAKIGKTSIPFKRDGYVMYTSDFQCFQNAAGQVLSMWNPGIA